jgi:hypothetical protein
MRKKPVNGVKKNGLIFTNGVASQLRQERKGGERLERLGLPML